MIEGRHVANVMSYNPPFIQHGHDRFTRNYETHPLKRWVVFWMVSLLLIFVFKQTWFAKNTSETFCDNNTFCKNSLSNPCWFSFYWFPSWTWGPIGVHISWHGPDWIVLAGLWVVRWCGTPLGGFRSLANNIVSRGKTPGFQQFFTCFTLLKHMNFPSIWGKKTFALRSNQSFVFHKLSFFLSRIWVPRLCRHIEETVTSGWATGRCSFQDPIHTGHPAEAGRRTTTLAATIDDGDRSGATRCLSLYPEAFWRFVCVCVCVLGWVGLCQISFGSSWFQAQASSFLRKND